MEEKSFEEQIYQEFVNRQLNISKKAVLIILSAMGCLFLFLGVVFLAFNSYDSEFLITGTVFACVGFGLILIGLLIYAILSKSKASGYQKFLERIDKYGMINTFDMAALIAIQQAKIKLFEKEIAELKRKID
jgi:ABC-type tungstate transport system substrate-binding protein